MSRKARKPPVKYHRAGFPNGNGCPYGFDDLPYLGQVRWSTFRAGLVRRILNNRPFEVGWREAVHDDRYDVECTYRSAVSEGVLF